MRSYKEAAEKEAADPCIHKLSEDPRRWLVCLGCALIFFCTCGVAININSVYSPFFIELYGFSRTQVAILSSFRSLINILSLFMIGVYYRHVPVKKGLLIGAAMSIAGYIVFYFSANHYAGYLIGNMFLGIGFGLTPLMALSMIIEKWFPVRMDAALGICSAASGASSLGLPMLLTSSVHRYGLSRTFLNEALFMILVVMAAALLIQEAPETCENSVSGDEKHAQPPASTKKKPDLDTPAATALCTTRTSTDHTAPALCTDQTSADHHDNKTSADHHDNISDRAMTSTSGVIEHMRSIDGTAWLYLSYFMIVLTGGVCGTGFSNISLLASTQGYSDAQMAAAVTLLGTMFMIGKCLFGIFCDRFTTRNTTILFSSVLLFGDILCCVSGYSLAILYFGVSVFGISVSVIAVGVVSWTADWISPAHRSHVRQMYQIMYTIGCLVFGFLSGVMADLCSGSYIPVYFMLTIMEGIVFLIILRIYFFIRIQKTYSA